MRRYIDADKLTVYFEALAKQAEMEGLYNMAHIHNRCLKIIEDAPTADVVEVVRCKDCKHSIPSRCGLTRGRFLLCRITDNYNDQDFYCAKGERRDDGT